MSNRRARFAFTVCRVCVAMLMIMATASFCCALGASDGGSLFFLTDGRSGGSSGQYGRIIPEMASLQSSASIQTSSFAGMKYKIGRLSHKRGDVDCALTESSKGDGPGFSAIPTKQTVSPLSSQNCIDTTHRRE